MLETETTNDLLLRIRELENRLEESEQLIEAIKAGEVDAFAIRSGKESEIYTLQSGDYAYRVLIEEFGEGAINVTEEGTIVYTNPYFSDLLNRPYEKVIGASIFDFIHSDSKEEFTRLFHIALAGKSKGEVYLSAGKAIPVYVSLTSLQPKLSTVGIILTDLSEKKKNEQIILEYQKDLESKNLKLMQNNEELASFAYIASHDLQEPLRKIQTFATRILEKEFDKLSDRGKDHFTRMHLAARRMQTLIEDILTYSRTNAGEQNYTLCRLKDIVEDVICDLNEDIQQRGAAVEVKTTDEVWIIPYQFRQLFYNLICNSLKFSRPSIPPRIVITSEIKAGSEITEENLRADQKYCHINVSDNGIGFDQAYLGKIFAVFQRLHGRDEYSGTGIGLAIVKKIVENHKGIVTATGEVDKGASFNIYIPILDLGFL